MDVAALKHAAMKIGLVGVALAQAIGGGLLVPERGEELERELSPIKRLRGELGDGFFDLDGVHGPSLGRICRCRQGVLTSGRHDV